ncbi:MAG: anthranilate synthase component I family protein [Paenibacillaceae bacterium]|nr:anthranilate synthase component I family protein [Paenibacillaceae bacterium]
MVVTSLMQWQEWASNWTMLPYVASYPLQGGLPASWEQAWEEAGASSFVLESGKDGRYTFLGLMPVESIEGTGHQAVVVRRDGSKERQVGRPLALIEAWMAPYRSPNLAELPKFAGGCVGYIGYDVIRTIERLPATAQADLPIPEYALLRYEEVWIVDQQEGLLYCAVHVPLPLAESGSGDLRRAYDQAAKRAERMKRAWDRFAAPTAADPGDEHEPGLGRSRRELYETQLHGNRLQVNVESMAGVHPAFGKAAYVDAVRAIQRYIAAGDVFQVNLSVRQSRRLTTEPEDIYEWLRLLNPSPYMGLLRFPGFRLVSASPEQLVGLEGRTVSTRPIAGTRPRGANAEEDARLADELLSSEKERAEHVMLVDLQRNDIGKISRYGSVRVDDFMVVEYYSHVMHIVSEVRGELAAGKNAFDVIAATFPGGTITGAPKIRTMEIIEELEPVRRGPYTGAIGWIDYNGNMELNIVIRTLLAVGETGHIQAGAGIVIDSDPEKEYIESINKAKALWKSIEYSEQWQQRMRTKEGSL